MDSDLEQTLLFFAIPQSTSLIPPSPSSLFLSFSLSLFSLARLPDTYMCAINTQINRAPIQYARVRHRRDIFGLSALSSALLSQSCSSSRRCLRRRRRRSYSLRFAIVRVRGMDACGQACSLSVALCMVPGGRPFFRSPPPTGRNPGTIQLGPGVRPLSGRTGKTLDRALLVAKCKGKKENL